MDEVSSNRGLDTLDRRGWVLLQLARTENAEHPVADRVAVRLARIEGGVAAHHGEQVVAAVARHVPDRVHRPQVVGGLELHPAVLHLDLHGAALGKADPPGLIVLHLAHQPQQIAALGVGERRGVALHQLVHERQLIQRRGPGPAPEVLLGGAVGVGELQVLGQRVIGRPSARPGPQRVGRVVVGVLDRLVGLRVLLGRQRLLQLVGGGFAQRHRHDHRLGHGRALARPVAAKVPARAAAQVEHGDTQLVLPGRDGADRRLQLVANRPGGRRGRGGYRGGVAAARQQERAAQGGQPGAARKTGRGKRGDHPAIIPRSARPP